MKMEDYFKLPVAQYCGDNIEDAGAGYVGDFWTDDMAASAAHAINCHDELVDALQALMDWQVKNVNVWNHPTWDYASLIIKKARGEK